MFLSNGALVKASSTTTLWEGPVRDWPGITSVLGLRAQSYYEIYMRQLWVATVIDKRAKAAARLPFKVYQRKQDGRGDASQTPFGKLMARPSRRIDPFSFWVWTVTMKDIYGEAPWLKLRDKARRPVELLPVHPTALVNETDSEGRVTWKVRARDGDIIVNREDLVLHREFNPVTTERGSSKLESLRATLENEEGARRANSAIWRNGGRPSVVLEHPQLLNDGAVSRLSTQWNDIHGGVDNWAKAAILEEGMTAKVIPLNIEDLQYVEARRLNREEVCAAYDVPPPVVHILDRATFSNITEQMRSMYRDTMGPVLGSLESTVEFELRDGRFGADREPDFGDGIYGEFLLDEVLRGAFEARAAAYQMADWMTLAEKREKENLPYIEGTDHLFLNSASLPLGPDGQLQQPAAADPQPQEPTTAPVAPPLALQPPKAAVVPPPNLRTVMGRLGRAKTVAAVAGDALVAGLNDDDAVPVLQAVVAAQLAGDSVEGLRSRLRALAGKD